MNNDLVQRFERLYGHRTLILEGVRAVAFRNIGHLARTMHREGIDRLTNPASLVCVQDAMLRDQGLQPTPTSRWLLSCGTFNAWETYLCLLLAELESYRSMRNSYALPPLDELIDEHALVVDSLETMRNKLLHPTKDVPYETTLVRYLNEVERRYPSHYFFAEHIQTLLDQYLHDLKDHLVVTLSDDIARLPDYQLHAFLAMEERFLRQALARAENTIDKNAIGELLRDHDELVRRLRIDRRQRNEPLDGEQTKRIRRLHDVKMKLVGTTPMPATDYHSAAAVQTPIHETLSSYIPIPPESDPKGFYRGSLLPPPVHDAQGDYATLIFRSTLLWNESLHSTDAMLRDHFPGKSRSEIRKLDDWSTRLPIPTTPEEIATAATDTSPCMVAFALLADPLRTYRSVVSASPELNVSELNRVATDDKIAKFSAWRNIVFHVPDIRVHDPYRLESQLLATSPEEYYMDLFSGLWRFFLRSA